MARPRSEDKQQAILAAALRVLTTRGLGAPTAQIAMEAGVSNGTLFLYFPTKAALYNALYLELKGDMASASLEGLPSNAPLRDQLEHLWLRWMAWSEAHPDRRRALEVLGISEELTEESRAKGHELMKGVAALLDQSRQGGPMAGAPLDFVLALMNAVAETTTAFAQSDSDRAVEHRKEGFEALWRMVT